MRGWEYPRVPVASARASVLREAERIVVGDRNDQYGTPEDNFGRIAAFWAVIFGHEVTTGQVAQAMIAVKLARLINEPTKTDSWVDIAGYAACGDEVSNSKERGQE